MTGRTLAIIERAHRGAVEQQYAHVLWLVHGLHRQTPMVVLLRGLAAVYALEGADDVELSLGDTRWGDAPDYVAAIERLHHDGADVVVSAATLESLGYTGRPLLAGVRSVTEEEVSRLFEAADRVWFL